MTVFSSPEVHAENPPETWRVIKAGSGWWLCPAHDDYPLDTFTTRKAAIAAIEDSFVRRLYDQETRWYAGETIPGWRTVEECGIRRPAVVSDSALFEAKPEPKVSLKEYAVWTLQHSTAKVKWFSTEDEARAHARRLSARKGRCGKYDYTVTLYPAAGKYQRLAVYSDGELFTS